MSADHTVSARFQAKCIVPKVKGKTLAAAKKAIVRARCSVGKVKRAYSARVKNGRVVSQKPKPGTKRSPGAKVSLVVSKRKKRR
jgi:serine/threonine-protein kinase